MFYTGLHHLKKNNRGFEIERAEVNNIGEPAIWHTVGFVSGNGTSAGISKYNFTDDKITSANYLYRLKQIDYDGTVSYSKTINIKSDLPLTFTLEQNYPNPFSKSTKIKFTVPAPSPYLKGMAGKGLAEAEMPGDAPVSLKIYDLLGHQVATLVNEAKKPGVYEVTIDLAGSFAEQISSGMYFYRLESGNIAITKKMIVIK